MFCYDSIPPYMRPGVRGFVEEGLPVGDFLGAIFRNDFAEAAVRADDTNGTILRTWALFLYNQIPARPMCWGSERSVALWMGVGGINGYEALEAEAKEEFRRKCRGEEVPA